MEIKNNYLEVKKLIFFRKIYFLFVTKKIFNFNQLVFKLYSKINKYKN